MWMTVNEDDRRWAVDDNDGGRRTGDCDSYTDRECRDENRHKTMDGNFRKCTTRRAHSGCHCLSNQKPSASKCVVVYIQHVEIITEMAVP